ncbi:MAG: hypothetical protein HYS22_07645 [Deltaproteobacteria bacterium]|nr:hypothetical protein [Deltaproteobacteria bacterium]
MALKRFASLFLALLVFIQMVIPTAAQAVYTVKKLSPEEAFVRSLDRGWIYSHADYDKGVGIVGQMVGVIESPPAEVWNMYRRSNDWPAYEVPTLNDCRALSEGFIKEYLVKKTKEIKEFYQLMNGRQFDQEQGRKAGARWDSYSFQSFDIPWPANDKWFILKNKNNETREKEGVFSSEWELVGGNVKHFAGSVTFEPFEGDPTRTKMDYKATVITGNRVPKFLLIWGAQQVMPRVIKAIRKYLYKTGKGKISNSPEESSALTQPAF